MTKLSWILGRVEKGLVLAEEEEEPKFTTTGLLTNDGEGENVMRSESRILFSKGIYIIL